MHSTCSDADSVTNNIVWQTCSRQNGQEKKVIDYFLRELKKSSDPTACVTREFCSSSRSPQNGANQLI